MTAHFSNQREGKTECDASFWSIKFIKTMKNQGDGKHYPLPTNMKDRSVGDGGHAPGHSPVSEVSPSRGGGAAPCQGGASSGRPEHSRESSELARVLHRRLS